MASTTRSPHSTLQNAVDVVWFGHAHARLGPERWAALHKAAKPVSVTMNEVTVTLEVDSEGVPDITVQRSGKHLKSVPAALRKQPDVKALTDRKTALKRQTAQVRRSLEDAMVRQDTFTEADFVALGRHPVVAPMLEMVIWTDDAGSTLKRHGEKWVDPTGKVSKSQGTVRIAHPVDLLGTGNWIDWQERFFDDSE